MSAFVHPENQKIIWNIVNSNPYVADYFLSNKNVSKESWFRGIIEKIYSQHQGSNLSVTELNHLNKDTLSFMIQSLHNTAPNFQTNHSSTAIPDINPIQKTEILTPPLIENTRQEQSISNFKTRQQEYENMTKKNIPDEINFKEGNKDEAIQDMDSLIKQHMKEREEQLQMTPPPNIIPKNELNNEVVVTSVPAAASMPSTTVPNESYAVEMNVIKEDISLIKKMLQKNNELLSLFMNKEVSIVQDIREDTGEPENIQTTINEKETFEPAMDISLISQTM